MNQFLPGFFLQKKNPLIQLLLLIVFFAASCASPEKARYFNNSIPTQYPLVDLNLDPVIQKADILNITVTSMNAEASQMYNMQNNIPTGYYGVGAAVPIGYLVDTEGLITYPILGKLQAEGLTKKQLVDSLTNALVTKKLLIDPIVSVRIVNFKVTVLGEVGNPMVISVSNEKISLLEAIGMAGDMTITARRDNVLLIREENGKRITRRINLNEDDIFRSPFYYLKNNDIVYVEANKAKVQSASRFTQLLPAIFSGLAFLAIIVDRAGR